MLRFALISIAPHCGVSLRNTCSASGSSLNGCRPLSAPPMRDPRPPASTTPVMSLLTMGLPGACVMSAADVRHFDARCVWIACRQRVAAAQLRVAVRACFPDSRDGRGNAGVAHAAAQQRAQVVPGGREEAQVKLAFR